MRSPIPDLSGQIFGEWLVLSEAAKSGYTRRYLCKCKCGVTRIVDQKSLRQGKSKSCGCLRPVGSQWTVEQHRQSKKKWRHANVEKWRESTKDWRMNNPASSADSKRRTNYRTKYGLELEQVEELHAEQGGKCAICKKSVALGGRSGAKVDHCHATGRVRGILCSTCNTALGSFKDDLGILASAISYLKKHQAV